MKAHESRKLQKVTTNETASNQETLAGVCQIDESGSAHEAVESMRKRKIT